MPTDHPLAPLGWDERRAAWWATAPPGTEPGRVVRADRGRVVVQAVGGPVTATANPAGWPDPGGGAEGEPTTPTTGDWVAVAHHPGGDLATVAGVLPRTSRLARVDALGRAEQVLAANVDLVLVVHGLDRPLRAGRLDRALVLALDGGARPVVVLTKADLLAARPGELAAVRDEATALAGEAPVHVVSAVTGEGLAPLEAELAAGRTLAVLGESGAGKSRLVNRLVGREAQATGAVRAGDAKGRHTTVTRDLLVAPGGGVVVDTPGLRAVGVGEVAGGLALAYPDIEALAEGCRFRDCAHGPEPGCAVRAAVGRGELDAARLDRYLVLRQEVIEAETRQEAAERRGAGRPAERRGEGGKPAEGRRSGRGRRLR